MAVHERYPDSVEEGLDRIVDIIDDTSIGSHVIEDVADRIGYVGEKVERIASSLTDPDGGMTIAAAIDRLADAGYAIARAIDELAKKNQ